MRYRSISILGLAVVGILVCGCFGPSPEDKSSIDVLKQEYGGEYEFDFSEDIYVLVTKRAEGSIVDDEEALQDIFRRFILDRHTSFVYLNFYTADGEFQYQLYYDHDKNAFGKNDAESN